VLRLNLIATEGEICKLHHQHRRWQLQQAINFKIRPQNLMKGTDSISIYTSLQLAVLDEFSDVTYSIRGKALTAKKDGNGNAERAMKV